MSINKLLIAMALGLALTACSKQEQAADAAASANEAAADAQVAADQAAQVIAIGIQRMATEVVSECFAFARQLLRQRPFVDFAQQHFQRGRGVAATKQ